MRMRSNCVSLGEETNMRTVRAISPTASISQEWEVIALDRFPGFLVHQYDQRAIGLIEQPGQASVDADAEIAYRAALELKNQTLRRLVVLDAAKRPGEP